MSRRGVSRKATNASRGQGRRMPQTRFSLRLRSLHPMISSSPQHEACPEHRPSPQPTSTPAVEVNPSEAENVIPISEASRSGHLTPSPEPTRSPHVLSTPLDPNSSPEPAITSPENLDRSSPVPAPYARLTVCRVAPDRTRLLPTGPIARAITDSFQTMWFMEGYCWKGLLPDQVNFYWDEFKKKVTWIESDALVKHAWKIQASARYSDNLSRYRAKFEKKRVLESHIKKEIWDEWVKKWDDPEYKAKRMKMSINRRTEKGGPGTGMSLHTSGSKSMLDRHLSMAGDPMTKPDFHKIFLETHTKKGKLVEFIDERSRQFEARYQEIFAEKSQQLEEGADTRNCMVEAFMEAAKGFNSKYAVYGAGSLSKALKEPEDLLTKDACNRKINLAQFDAEAAATISTLQSRVMALEARYIEHQNSQQQLSSQVSKLSALVKTLISGSNEASGSANAVMEEDNDVCSTNVGIYQS